MHNLIVKSDFLLNDKQYRKNEEFELNLLNLKESTFVGKVKIQFYKIKKADFYNTKFEELADFYQTKFDNVIFERTDFKDISVFSEADFNCDVNFQYTKFLSKSIFRDTIIKGKLNLRDTIFNDEANFLDISSTSKEITNNSVAVKVANRETARIIKHHFEKSGNRIEANRYHALELEQRRCELEKNKSSNWNEHIVFKVHDLSSEHSTNWLLALSWILCIGVCTTLLFTSWTNIFIFPFLYLLYKFTSIFSKNKSYNMILYATIIFVLTIYNIEDNFKNMALINLTNSYFIFIGDIGSDELSSWQRIVLFFNKVSLGYLYYQFLMSIRKDTRN